MLECLCEYSYSSRRGDDENRAERVVGKVLSRGLLATERQRVSAGSDK